ncbi:hypothetical protein [Longispora albida]|uniref:hypothetical protein n=1 Tax=Longispora albida TaxID=203523 RepID=UPI000360EEF7|nr:hypothetical protein [Longispora albida]
MNNPATSTQPAVVWTADSIAALGAFTTLQIAGQIFGMSQSHAYALAAAGEFPVPVLRAGRRWKVPVAPILAAARHTTPPAAESGTAT